MKATKLHRKWLTFVDDSGKESFRKAQCECGNLCNEHVEIDTDKAEHEDLDYEGSAYAVEVICAACFTKGIVDGTIRVVG